MEISKRNYMMDNLKVLLIFLVVFGHVIEYYINDSIILKSIYLFIYSFHMPLFVFVSGYFSKNTEKCYKGAVKNLLIPYIFFNILWYTSVYLVTKDVMFSIIYPGWTLWYLVSLFFWRISLKYLVKIKYIIPISFIAAILLGVVTNAETALSVSRTICFLPFFLLGYFTDERNINNIIRKRYLVSIIGIIGVLFLAFYISKNNMLDYKFLYNSQSYINSGMTIFQGIISRIILYIISITVSICIINVIPRKKHFYTNIGKSTMSIYVFHIYLIIFIFFLIPVWNMGWFRNTVLLISPVIITYILSVKLVEKIYMFIFKPINLVIYNNLVRLFRLIVN